MAEYIDKDLLLEEVLLSKKRNPHYDSDIRRNHDHEHDHFVAMLCKQPTADVREVRRGKWIHIGENSTGKIFMCSVCDKCINPNKKDVELGRVEEKTTFCPSCDAKMEVE